MGGQPAGEGGIARAWGAADQAARSGAQPHGPSNRASEPLMHAVGQAAAKRLSAGSAGLGALGAEYLAAVRAAIATERHGYAGCAPGAAGRARQGAAD